MPRNGKGGSSVSMAEKLRFGTRNPVLPFTSWVPWEKQPEGQPLICKTGVSTPRGLWLSWESLPAPCEYKSRTSEVHVEGKTVSQRVCGPEYMSLSAAAGESPAGNQRGKWRSSPPRLQVLLSHLKEEEGRKEFWVHDSPFPVILMAGCRVAWGTWRRSSTSDSDTGTWRKGEVGERRWELWGLPHQQRASRV